MVRKNITYIVLLAFYFAISFLDTMSLEEGILALLNALDEL
jgi:hypothetical protein